MKRLIPKPLIPSYINHSEFISVNNVFRDYNEIKEEMKSLGNAKKYTT